MITFACKVIKKEEIVRCTFNLSKTEYTVLEFFFKTKGKHTVMDISKKLKLERTTVQKAIKKLMKKRLLKRTRENLKGGGYVFLYELESAEKIKRRIKHTVSEWYKNVIKKINEM